MIKLNLTIDDEAKSFNIPQSWSDVSVGTYEKLANIDKTNENEFQMAIDVLCAISGMSLDDAYALPVDKMPDILEHITFTNTEIPLTDKEFILIDGEEYYLKKDFNQLENGDVISLELLNKKHGNNIEKAMAEMLCVFLRKKKENGNLESFKNSFMEREDLYREKVSIADVYNMFLFFFEWKNSIVNNYKGLFGSGKEKKGRFESLNPTSIDPKFAYHQMIHTIIKETNSTEKEAYKKNYISTLNWLSYLKNVEDVKMNIQKQAK